MGRLAMGACRGPYRAQPPSSSRPLPGDDAVLRAVKYQAGIGGSGVWAQANSRPLGMGTGSGWDITVLLSRLYGPVSCIGIHDNEDFAKPSKALLKESDFFATTATDEPLLGVFDALGSGQVSTVEIIGCRTNGDIALSSLQWLSAVASNQPADPFEQFVVSGYGNSPMVSKVSAVQRALRIASATTGSGSRVSLAGSTQALLDALFGTVFSRDGGGGVPGHVWGWHNIKEMSVGGSSTITPLGRRLGNRTGSPWTLAVSIDGGAAVNVVFNTDLTAATNASILATINAALGSAGTASEYNVASRHRPRFTDEERELVLSGSAALPIRSWGAFATSRNRVRPMTSSDAVGLSAGCAYGDDIVPGGFGRVKEDGLFGTSDLIINGSPTLAFGDLLEIDAGNPGQLVKNNASSRPVLKLVRANTFQRV